MSDGVSCASFNQPLAISGVTVHRDTSPILGTSARLRRIFFAVWSAQCSRATSVAVQMSSHTQNGNQCSTMDPTTFSLEIVWIESNGKWRSTARLSSASVPLFAGLQPFKNTVALVQDCSPDNNARRSDPADLPSVQGSGRVLELRGQLIFRQEIAE